MPDLAQLAQLALPTLLVAVAGCREPASSTSPHLEESRTLEGVRGAVHVAPDGSRLAVAREGGGITLVDLGRRWIEDLDPDAVTVALPTAEEPLWWATSDGHVYSQRPGAAPEFFARPVDGPVDGLDVAGERLAWSSSEAGVGGVFHLGTGEELLRLDGLDFLHHPGWRGPRVLLFGGGRWALARRSGEPLVLRPLVPDRSPVVLRGYPATSDPRAAATPDGLFMAEPGPPGTPEQGVSLRRLDLDTGSSEVVATGLRGGALVNLLAAPGGATVVEGDPLEPGVVVHWTRALRDEDDAEGGPSPGALPLVLDDPSLDLRAHLPLGFDRDPEGGPRLITSGTEGLGAWSWSLEGDLDPRRFVAGPFEHVVAAGVLEGPWAWTLLRRAGGRLDLLVTSERTPADPGDTPPDR